MKRLLAAGAGDIYQICHVVRALERGRLHNAEFTLIEWYRAGYSLDALMSEVEALVRELLAGARCPPRGRAGDLPRGVSAGAGARPLHGADRAARGARRGGRASAARRRTATSCSSC